MVGGVIGRRNTAFLEEDDTTFCFLVILELENELGDYVGGGVQYTMSVCE
jgi:hypothetical protein